jgi:hypothetical protein
LAKRDSKIVTATIDADDYDQGPEELPVKILTNKFATSAKLEEQEL